MLSLYPQISREAQDLYYRNTTFHFRTGYGNVNGNSSKICRWLDAIGHNGRANLRSLEIQVRPMCASRIVQIINSKLSEKATVVYWQAKNDYNFGEQLLADFWAVGTSFKQPETSSGPVLKVLTSHGGEYIHHLSGCPKQPYHAHTIRTELIFLPNQGWFGNAISE